MRCKNTRNDLFLLSQESLWNISKRLLRQYWFHNRDSCRPIICPDDPQARSVTFWGRISLVSISVVPDTINTILCAPSLVLATTSIASTMTLQTKPRLGLAYNRFGLQLQRTTIIFNVPVNIRISTDGIYSTDGMITRPYQRMAS